MSDMPPPALLCLGCRTELPLDPVSDRIRCVSCEAVYPVHFGIVDLRGPAIRVAGATFDVEADLVDAERVAQELASMSYSDWFFSAVDRRVERLEDPRFRELMKKYYRDERDMFGRHGAAILEKLDAYLAQREPQRHQRWLAAARVVLEAGCGTGQYPVGFASRFGQVLVTDISYVSLVQAKAFASESGLTNVRIFASNLEHIPLHDGSVDLVHCNGVIEHVSDPGQVVGECARVTSDAGITLILSPNLYSLYTEAHFRVPGFGFWPMPLRRWLAYRASGARSFQGTALRSLGDLRRFARQSFRQHRIYFLPPRLPVPVRRGATRRLIHLLLRSRLTRGIADLVLNRALLQVVPYHVLLGFKR